MHWTYPCEKEIHFSLLLGDIRLKREMDEQQYFIEQYPKHCRKLEGHWSCRTEDQALWGRKIQENGKVSGEIHGKWSEYDSVRVIATHT